MLFLYEQHQVIGKHEAAFEDAYRTELAPMLAKTTEARLLWYFNIAHGAGRSYQTITVTGLPDSQTWEALRARLKTGDLTSWLKAVQSYRYRVVSKVLIPETDSPFAPDLHSLDAETTAEDPGLYIEEVIRTGSPREHAPASSAPGIDLFASFTTAFGTGPTPELTRLYAIKDLAALVDLITNEPRRPMDDDSGTMSRLLRTAPWSPLH